jgi:hypothetical protein
VLGKRPKDFLHLQENEITPIIKKLNAFTEKVREDIEKKVITEADGQKLIEKATNVVNMLATTYMYKTNKIDKCCY